MYIYIYVYTHIYFDSTGSSLQLVGSLLRPWSFYLFVAWGLQVLRSRGSKSSHALQLQHLGLCCSMACRFLVSQPRIELSSPPLEGEFLITGPPAKSLQGNIFNDSFKCFEMLYLGNKLTVVFTTEIDNSFMIFFFLQCSGRNAWAFKIFSLDLPW